jgi:hypothetical protein
MLKTCEELAELTTQLCKRLSQSPKSIDADIVDEIADGFVVLAQMRHLFGMEKVDERVLFKLNRTMERIRARNQKMPEEKGCV